MQSREEIIKQFNKQRKELTLHGNDPAIAFNPNKKKKKKKKKNKKKKIKTKPSPVFVNQLTPNKPHPNRKLICKCIVEPYMMNGIQMIVEDDFESIVHIQINDAQINKYKNGTKLCMHEPHYKLINNKYLIKIDDASKIEILPNSTAVGINEKSVSNWKDLGNECFLNKNYTSSNQCYSKGINFYNNISNDNVITALLNNRCLCYLKLGGHRLAFINIIASKYINSNIFKTWHREIICLNKLNYCKQAYDVWNIAVKLFPNNITSLNNLKKKYKISDTSVDVMYVNDEWDVLGVIVQDILPILCNNDKSNESANEFKEIGNRKFQEKNYEDAIKYYTDALLIHYNTLSILLSNRCASFINSKQHENAFKDATISAILNPNNIKAWYRRCIMSYKLDFNEIGDMICKQFNNKNNLFTKLLQNYSSNNNNFVLNENKQNDDNLNEEEKTIQLEKQLKNPMSTEQASMMNNLFSSLPSNIQSKMGFINIPKFHKLFANKRKYPQGINIKKCNDILSGAYENARAIGMHEIHLLREEYELSAYDIMKRIGSNDPDRIKWYAYAQPGDTDASFYDKTNYQSIRHSFSNAPDNNIIVYSGQTHIAIGFCDLALLSKCTIKSSDKPGPVTFIGVDMSSYSIAKSYVINEMLKDKDISAASILEVWYSATWTKPTDIDFRKTVTNIINNTNINTNNFDDEVYKYIKHWFNSKGVRIKKARTLWIESLTDVFADIGSFNKLDDILDYAEYIISGDLKRENIKSFCGNITIFDNIKQCPKKAKNENIYHCLEMNEAFIKIYLKSKSLKEATTLMFLSYIQKLKNWVLNKDIIITFINDKISPNNITLINKLKNMKPYSVSWSNCIDYMNPTKFHTMAKEIGYNDCVHFAYSMNWTYSIQGCTIIDYEELNQRKSIMKSSKLFIKDWWKTSKYDQIFRFPPITHAIDYGSISVIFLCQKKWIKWFMSKQIAKTYVCYDEKNIMPIFFAPLYRTSWIMNFVWTYDEQLPLL